MAHELNEQGRLLETALPVLKEKSEKGLIRSDSHRVATSLIEFWRGRGLWSDKQTQLVGKLLERANRKHRKGGPITVQSTVIQEVDVEKVTAEVVRRIGEAGGISVDAVADAVFQRIEARAPRKVEIVVQKADGKRAAVKGPRHAQFERLLRAASVRLPEGFAPNIFLQGEASSGKTTGARHLAEALGLDWHFNGAISFPHEMLGFIDGAGKYHRTPFRDAYEKGGVYTFDEVDRSDPVALLAVNPHLANGVATFPDRQVRRHRDCVIVCTANTWGLGADSNYSGATKLDAAFLSRFPVRICWDIDPELENAIVSNRKWLDRVRAARARARAVGLKVLIDTRAAQAGQALIQCGYTEDEAASMTYLANLKPEQRSQVEGTQ